MTIEEAIIEKLRALSHEKQQLVLSFAGSLTDAQGAKHPLRNPRGMWAKYDVSVSGEDIARLRREMWEKFPRQDL